MNNPVTNEGFAAGQIVIFPPDRSIGVLAVAPPYLVGNKPQKDGALGINIHMAHSDIDGVLGFILAYINMAVGDDIEVFVEHKNAPVAKIRVTDAHFDNDGNAKDIPFYLSVEDLEDRFSPQVNANQDFWYEIQRVSGNTAEPSPRIPLFYKYPAPGEPDIDGGKPFNQGLKLPVPSETIVDKSVIEEGMSFEVKQYFNQSIGDKVILSVGALRQEITVTKLGDVVFELTPSQLQKLVELKPNSLVVRWAVYDVVENGSGWSDSLLLPVESELKLLAAPLFAVADANVVDYDQLAGGTMPIVIVGNFSRNDLVVLTLQGVTRNGESVTHSYSQTLSIGSQVLTFPIENERVRNLISGSARATYTLTKAGQTQYSKPADVTVWGTSRPLGPPTVEPVIDGKLPLDTAMAKVTCAYWPAEKGAHATLRWQTIDKDGITVLLIFGQIVTDATQPIVFNVPARYITPYANSPLIVQSTITNPDKDEVVSELTELMFGEAIETREILENFDSQRQQYIVAGQSINLPSMRITYNSGPGRIGIAGLLPGHPAIPGQREGHFINSSDENDYEGEQHIRMDFDSNYRRISFWHSYMNVLVKLNFYGRTGQLLGSTEIQGQNHNTPVFFQYEASGIALIEFVHPWDWYALDYFKLES